ncbi:hypothetical protein Tco_0891995 [Tanacetum coccineum]|uniref:Uncharacterized protein n=1 Tax=Tanacetum coccineum TaxID=301880 RepID=A0ABQ5C601_9ASTR
MYTFSPMMVANFRKHHCRVCPYTREVLVLSTNLEIQTKHYSLVFRNRRGDEAIIKKLTHESWKIRIHRYIRGKPNGKLIWKSIQNGPTPHPMITDLILLFSVLHLFNTSIKSSTGKEIGDNVEMLMQGSVGLIQQRKEDLSYTISQSLRASCQKDSKEKEQSTSIVDPLAYVAHTTSAPVLSSPSTPSPQPTAQSPNDALMATMTQIANLLSGFQKLFHHQQPSSGLPPNQGTMLRCMMVTLLLEQFCGRLQEISTYQRFDCHWECDLIDVFVGNALVDDKLAMKATAALGAPSSV